MLLYCSTTNFFDSQILVDVLNGSCQLDYRVSWEEYCFCEWHFQCCAACFLTFLWGKLPSLWRVSRLVERRSDQITSTFSVAWNSANWQRIEISLPLLHWSERILLSDQLHCMDNHCHSQSTNKFNSWNIKPLPLQCNYPLKGGQDNKYRSNLEACLPNATTYYLGLSCFSGCHGHTTIGKR